MEVYQREVTEIFPTALYSCKLDKAFCESAYLYLKNLKDSGEGNSNINKWKSGDDLHHHEFFSDLVDVVVQEVKHAANIYKYDIDDVYINNMFGSIVKPTHEHNTHTHPNSIFSGILYLNLPEKCNEVYFADPISMTKEIQLPLLEYNQFNTSLFKPNVEVGDLIIFPSSLPHGVVVANDNYKGDRSTLSFNTWVKAQMRAPTVKHNFV